MCPHSEKEKPFKIGDMAVDMAKALLKEGKGAIKSVKFNWRGEPTLYKYLLDLIAYAKECEYVETMINTNLNCSQGFLQKVLSAGIDKIIVSIDSFHDNVYSQIRKGGILKLVLQNLEFLKDVSISGKFKFTLVQQARRQKLNASEVFPKGVLVNPATQRTSSGEYLLGNQKAIGRKDCLMPVRRLLVSWNGKVYGCCADWFEQNSIGVIDTGRDDNLKSIWKGDPIQKLRKLLKNGDAFKHEPCKSCFSRESYRWKK